MTTTIRIQVTEVHNGRKDKSSTTTVPTSEIVRGVRQEEAVGDTDQERLEDAKNKAAIYCKEYPGCEVEITHNGEKIKNADGSVKITFP